VDALVLVGIAFLSSFAWVFNCDAAAILQVTQRGGHAVPTAMLLAGGQGASWLLLFGAGERIRAGWPWFNGRCERVRARWGDRLARRAPLVLAASGLLGAPPTAVLAVLAPGMGIRLGQLLPIMIATRLVRFTVVGLLADQISRLHFFAS
jgi:membrane protein YqaA with SNARE-associated domain